MLEEHDGAQSRRNFLIRGGAALGAIGAGGLLAACGGGGKSGGSGGGGGGGGEVAGDITFLKGPNAANDLDLQKAAAAKFMAEKPKIKVTPSMYDWASVETKLTSSYASNTPPDVCYMADTLWPKFAAAGALADITDRVKDPSWASEFNAFPKAGWNGLTYKDRVYGVPLLVGVISGVYVNLDLMEKAGIKDFISSYDVMRQAAKETTGGNQFGFYMPVTHNDFAYQSWLTFIYNGGGAVLNKAYTAGDLDKPGVAEGFELLRQLHYEDKSTPAPGTYSNEAAQALFRAGRIAIYEGAGGNEKIISGKAMKKPVKFKYDYFPLPPGPAGQNVIDVAGTLHVAAKSKQQDAAWEYVKFLASGPQATAFIRGIGGDLQPGRTDIADSVYPPSDKKFAFPRRLLTEVLPKARPIQPHPRMIDMLKAIELEYEQLIRGKQHGTDMVKRANDAVTQIVSA
jgi:multiple sugar transport system substrate-binding protein